MDYENNCVLCQKQINFADSDSHQKSIACADDGCHDAYICKECLEKDWESEKLSDEELSKLLGS